MPPAATSGCGVGVGQATPVEGGALVATGGATVAAGVDAAVGLAEGVGAVETAGVATAVGMAAGGAGALVEAPWQAPSSNRVDTADSPTVRLRNLIDRC